MFFQAASPPPPQLEVVRAESAYSVAAHHDLPLTFAPRPRRRRLSRG